MRAIDLHFVRRIGLSLAAMLMAGFMEGALISLIPVWALRQGFTEVQAGVLLFAFMFGHGTMPPLMGMLGDRFGLRRGWRAPTVWAARASLRFFFSRETSRSPLFLSAAARRSARCIRLPSGCLPECSLQTSSRGAMP